MFCDDCGYKLTDNFYCIKCEIHNRRIQAIDEKLKEKSYLPWQAKYKNWSWSNNSYAKYFCHICKYFMYHSIIWCPKCGNKFVQEVLNYKEVLDKYPMYREGY